MPMNFNRISGEMVFHMAELFPISLLLVSFSFAPVSRSCHYRFSKSRFGCHQEYVHMVDNERTKQNIIAFGIERRALHIAIATSYDFVIHLDEGVRQRDWNYSRK